MILGYRFVVVTEGVGRELNRIQLPHPCSVSNPQCSGSYVIDQGELYYTGVGHVHWIDFTISKKYRSCHPLEARAILWFVFMWQRFPTMGGIVVWWSASSPHSQKVAGVISGYSVSLLSLCISPVTDWQLLQGKLCCSQQNNETKNNTKLANKYRKMWEYPGALATQSSYSHQNSGDCVGTLIVALKQKPSIITGITLFIIWLIN